MKLSNKLYPVTIITDAFDGKYSGSKFLAINNYPDKINSVLYGNDFALNFVFWDNYDSSIDGIIGMGDTPDDAYNDLRRKLMVIPTRPITKTSVEGQTNSICKELDDLKEML